MADNTILVLISKRFVIVVLCFLHYNEVGRLHLKMQFKEIDIYILHLKQFLRKTWNKDQGLEVDLTNLEELSFLTVFALPKASRMGFACSSCFSSSPWWKETNQSSKLKTLIVLCHDSAKHNFQIMQFFAALQIFHQQTGIHHQFHELIKDNWGCGLKRINSGDTIVSDTHTHIPTHIPAAEQAYSGTKPL